MNIIFPIFPQNDLETELMWSEIEGIPLFLCTAKAISKVDEFNVVICTDQEKVAEYKDLDNIDCHHIDADITAELFDFLPSGSQASIAHLVDLKPENKDSDFIILNYRNPLLTVDIVHKAYQEYVQSDEKPLLSMIEILDHPAQLNAYYQIIDVDSLCLIDSDYNNENINGLRNSESKSKYRISKPWYFDWNSHGIEDLSKSELYVGSIKKSELKIKHNKERKESDKPKFLFVSENENMARRVFPADSLQINGNNQIVGLPFFSTLENTPCVFVKRNNKSEISFYLNQQLVHDSTMIRVWPLCGREIIESKVKNIFLSDHFRNELIEIEFAASTFVGPVDKFSVNTNISGYIIAILKSTTREYADYSEPLEVEEGYWHVDPLNGTRIDAQTGKPILGRQDLPMLLSPDSSISIFKGDELNGLNEALSNYNSIGFILDETMSISISSRIDFLKLKARTRIDELGLC